jgi:hypothetical protein
MWMRPLSRVRPSWPGTTRTGRSSFSYKMDRTEEAKEKSARALESDERFYGGEEGEKTLKKLEKTT